MLRLCNQGINTARWYLWSSSSSINGFERSWNTLGRLCLCTSTYAPARCHKSSTLSSSKLSKNSRHVVKSYPEFNHCLFAHYRL